jgi:mono/diheme cytochrome c family protein
MKVNRIFLVAGVIAMFALASCGGGNKEQTQEEENTTQNTEQEQQGEEQQEVATADEMDFSKGEEIYKSKCIVCHMETGLGVPGAFPPLANSDYLLENPKRAVAQVLNGSNEEMVVNGETYTTPMEPQVDNYEDAVAVVNYILNTWGNDGGTISVEDVQDIEIVR